MQLFEHAGQKYISINGKDYFLLRGYKADYRKFIFIQVSGKTALNKEDLPSKAWEIIYTKAGGQRVWTAFVKSYFAYESKKENGKLAFLGGSTIGSYFIALKILAQRWRRKLAEKELLAIAKAYATGERSHYRLEKCSDLGNSDVDLVLLDFGGCFDETCLNRILKGK